MMNVSIFAYLEVKRMKENEKYKIYDNLWELHGEVNQILVAIEELQELGKVLTKIARGRTKRSSMQLIEELADVDICIEQIKYHYNINNRQLAIYKNFKLDRLNEFYTRNKEGVNNE